VKLHDFSVRGIESWIDEICDWEFYEKIPVSDNNFHIGQFFVGHVKYPSILSPKVLQIEQHDKENELNTIFKIADYDPSEQKQRMHPIKQLDLGSQDRLYISAGKKRTVILLRTIESPWIVNRNERLALCLPIASFKSQHDRKFILNIQLFRFPQYFYIKPSEKGAKMESAARFELIQYVNLDYLEPVQNENKSFFKLSSYILKILYNHLCKYIFDKPYDDSLESEIFAFREIMMEGQDIKEVLS